jgi:hypothetical protein
MTNQTSQIITDMFIMTDFGIIHTTNRSNNAHIVNGASLSLIMSGEQNSRYCNDVSLSENDTADVLDYMGCKINSGVVVAKRVRVWDMSKPTGQRCLSDIKSKNFSVVYTKYMAYTQR